MIRTGNRIVKSGMCGAPKSIQYTSGRGGALKRECQRCSLCYLRSSGLQRDRPSMKDYLALTKPRITWLILMSTGVGYYFGAKAGWQFWTLLHTILGTGLMASGTAALNQWYERDADAKMRRTQARPLPSGRLIPRRALIFGSIISA